ncbi:MAG: hypothetical protein AB1439_01915 [candidate division FCPU426 bacterium]
MTRRKLLPLVKMLPLVIAASAAAWQPVPAAAVRMETFILDLQIEDTHQQNTMVVEFQPGLTVVTYYNEFGDKEVAFFEPPHRLMRAMYYNPERRLTSQTVYHYREKYLEMKGDLNVRYPLEGDIFDNSGSLFYLFSVFQPPVNGRLNFKLVQSNLSRIPDPFLRFLIAQLVGPVPMYLKHVKTENLAWQSSEVSALCFELAIAEGRLASFWPYKYYFWYDAKRQRLLQHQGQTTDKKMAVYRVIDSYEWEKPEPELPTL